jgi:uncharacterized protein
MKQTLAQSIAACLMMIALSGAPAQPAPTSTPPTDPLKEAQGWLKAGDFARAYPAFLRLARSGSAAAQFELAGMLIRGKGVKKDEPQAADWCLRAAQQGYVPAECQLGRLYEDGIGVPDDMKEAVHWLQLANSHGSARAAYELSGICMAEPGGPAGGEKDFLIYLQLACDRGNIDAMEHLGDLYRNGQIGTAAKVDKKNALKWYQKAEAGGDTEAIFKAALILDQGGNGVISDKKAAAAAYERALKLGLNYSGAAIRLSEMYHFGEGGIPKDEKLALYYKRLSEKLNKSDDVMNRGVLSVDK